MPQAVPAFYGRSCELINPDSANKFRSYVKGWKDGAASRMPNPVFKDNPLKPHYDFGYADGCVARQAATKKASDTYGYEPSILRASDKELYD